MGIKVIIYDDDTDILLVTSVILQRKGYEVICREDCKTLQQDLQSFQPQVILMDNWMPDMSGVQAIQQIKSHEDFKHIPVIFFSANSNVEELAREAGADSLLKKPFDILALQQMIAELVP
ncbi:MAG TPA: response regulator [Chitinophagaceae bacterium]|nr:response regulator [Chitinophagaceae bacterium]